VTVESDTLLSQIALRCLSATNCDNLRIAPFDVARMKSHLKLSDVAMVVRRRIRAAFLSQRLSP
jgi:hypothetical protein